MSSYNPEIRDAVIKQIQKIQDIVGYHFPWCNKCECDCGMRELRIAKHRLREESLTEFALGELIDER